MPHTLMTITKKTYSEGQPVWFFPFQVRSQVKIFSLFATHFYNCPYPQSGCMSPGLLNCLRIVFSKSFMIN